MCFIYRVKMNCINCGDLIGNERDSDDKYCSDQCKVEYELEHNRKWKILSFDIAHIANKEPRWKECGIKRHIYIYILITMKDPAL